VGFVVLTFLWFEAGIEVRVLCANLAPGVDEAGTRAMFDTGTFLETADVGDRLEVSTPWDLHSSRCLVDWVDAGGRYAAVDEGGVVDEGAAMVDDGSAEAEADRAGRTVAAAAFERRVDLAGVAAWIGTVLLGAVIVFQAALATGAPLGAGAWGGAHPGRLPAGLRAASAASAVVLAFAAWALLSRAGALGADPPGWTGAAVALFALVFALSTVGSLVSASRIERRLMTPVAMLLWAVFVVVGLSK
jgi:hypothetical protein